MCGVAAIFSYHYASPAIDKDELRQVRDSMRKRGPDGSGEWFSADGRVALGHRRLAIIDLSPRGSQPMLREKYAVSFNGEIYNYRLIRSRLEKKGYVFQSDSDTEVLLHLYAESQERMVEELRGMYAFILWDDEKKRMLLARDHYGIKPLYYADDGWSLRAASQVKALLQSRHVSRQLDPAGAAGFFLLGSVPEPYTLYQEIREVPAGSVVIVDETGPSVPKKYFSISKVFASSCETPADENGIREKIHDVLSDCIHQHLVSDVPVGTFLSGGVDSGVITSFAADFLKNQLKTMTLGFEEFRNSSDDELPLARETAKTYGATHHEYVLSLSEFNRDLPDVFQAMDQPTIDGVNTYFISKAATQMGFKVSLSGLGADELFGGYPLFYSIPKTLAFLRPLSLIPFAGDAFRSIYPIFSFVFPKKNPKIAGLLKYSTDDAEAYFLHRGLFMPWELKNILGKETAEDGLRRLRLLEQIRSSCQPIKNDRFRRIVAMESSFYLLNQLLRDADWAGMAHSLEIRTPFVDHMVLRALAPLLSSRRFPDHKRRLANSAKSPLPPSVISRKKTGFTTPVAGWLEINKDLDRWKEEKSLKTESCPWARRYAYVVYKRYLES